MALRRDRQKRRGGTTATRATTVVVLIAALLWALVEMLASDGARLVDEGVRGW